MAGRGCAILHRGLLNAALSAPWRRACYRYNLPFEIWPFTRTEVDMASRRRCCRFGEGSQWCQPRALWRWSGFRSIRAGSGGRWSRVVNVRCGFLVLKFAGWLCGCVIRGSVWASMVGICFAMERICEYEDDEIWIWRSFHWVHLLNGWYFLIFFYRDYKMYILNNLSFQILLRFA